MLLTLWLASCVATVDKDKEVSLDSGPKYEVKLMNGALPRRSYANRKSVVMTKRDGKKYRCYLPRAANNTEASEPNEVQPALQVGIFLKPLVGKCFYRLEGWWTYEYCFLKSIRQFHQEKVKNSNRPDAATVTQEYVLGKYWSNTDDADRKNGAGSEQHEPQETQNDEDEQTPSNIELQLSGELTEDTKTRSMHWKQVYGNGSHCDLTG